MIPGFLVNNHQIYTAEKGNMNPMCERRHLAGKRRGLYRERIGSLSLG